MLILFVAILEHFKILNIQYYLQNLFVLKVICQRTWLAPFPPRFVLGLGAIV